MKSPATDGTSPTGLNFFLSLTIPTVVDTKKATEITTLKEN